jgi:hypothetical protein
MLVQALFEGGFDVALRRKASDPSIASFVLITMLGAFAGFLSVLLFPTHLIGNETLRYVSAVVSPFLVAWGMTQVGKLRMKRGQERFSLEYFLWSWLFAFSFGAVRVLLAK